MKNQLLIEMDNNVSGSKSCVLLCATNCPWDLDSAFIRRFQCRLYAPLPEEYGMSPNQSMILIFCSTIYVEKIIAANVCFKRAARLHILQDQCEGVGVNMSEEDWKCIVKHTEGYSGADLTNLAMYAVQEPIGELEFNPATFQRYGNWDRF